MNFRLLNEEEINNIYDTHMKKDFPPNELKPVDAIIEMTNTGRYEPLGLFDNDSPIGYVFMTIVPNTNILLLDYLAVFDEYRGKTIGGRVLSLLTERYPDKIIYIESENPDFMESKDIPERRLNFYKRNGAIETGILAEVWGAHYVILYIAKESVSLTREESRKAIDLIYKTMIPNEETRKKRVIIE